MNGGIIATIIDCHAICTAAASAYRDAGREPGDDGPGLYYATGRLELDYQRPTPIDATIELEARVIERTRRSYVLSCDLHSAGKTRVRATIEAVRVPDSWVLG